MTFVFLYTMYFFQMDGDKLIRKILYYLPLNSDDESLMLNKFTSVTRATLKGSLVIGVLQGGLAGGAFAIAGIDNAVFWGTVMAVLSIIPGVGAALVWVPAVIYLALSGHMGAAIALFIWCAGLVGTDLDKATIDKLRAKALQMNRLLRWKKRLWNVFGKEYGRGAARRLLKQRRRRNPGLKVPSIR